MNKKLVVGIIIGVILLSLGIAITTGPIKEDKIEGEKIGVIYVEGQITGSRSEGGMFGGMASGPSIMEQLKQAREDNSIKAVIIRINSPGGSSAASQEIGIEIEKLRAGKKIVVASMGDVAASGGYWLAAKADKIIADPATMTGSIGVIMDLQNMQDLFEKVGISPETIKSGLYKDMGSSNRPLTTAERQILQTMVNDIYQQFVDVVVKGRKMDRNKVLALADGRVYTGRQAKANGLVDELGNYYDAIDLTAKLAGIKGEPVLYELGPKNTFERLFGGVGALQQLPGGTFKLSAKELQTLIDVIRNQQALIYR